MNKFENKPMTPEEYKWRKSVENPENIRRKLRLQYWLLRAWSAISLAWIILLCLGYVIFERTWIYILVIVAGFFNCILGIVNAKRLLAVKKPF